MSFKNQTDKIVELGFIYALKDPRNKEIFYIGATESAPKDRLAGHYSHFKEYLLGTRNPNKRFLKFEEFFPELAEIELIEIVQNDYLYKKEIEYIKSYSELYNLTNQTKGGEGGDTFSLQNYVDKLKISNLISIKASNKIISEEHKKLLSDTRMGDNNPMAGKTSVFKPSVILDNDGNFLKYVIAPFEISSFLDLHYGIENHKLHAGRASNISKALKKSGNCVSSGFKFKRLDLCTKEIQDIVQQDYESNLNKVE